MHSVASRFLRRSSFALLALAGCASVPTPAASPMEASPAHFARILDSVARASAAGDETGMSAPRIRLVVSPATYHTTRYVDASFRLTDDAYVLVLAVDLDRRVRVLYPDAPDQSGFATKVTTTRLTRFFAGFGGPIAGSYGRYDTQYNLSQRLSPFGAGGVLIAIASDRPLQFDRIVGEDGDWHERQLAQLVFEQTLHGAAQSVGRALVLAGQEFSTDYSTFSGNRTLGAYSSFASNAVGGCGDSYGDGYGSAYHGGIESFGAGRFGSDGSVSGTRFVGFYQRDGVTYARYASGGACSRPVYYDIRVPAPRPGAPDTLRHDSTAMTRRWASAPAGDAAARSAIRRLGPPASHDGAPERPVSAAGLRFRAPEIARAPEARLMERPMDRPMDRPAAVRREPVRDAAQEPVTQTSPRLSPKQ